jgi:hypothetical protein
MNILGIGSRIKHEKYGLGVVTNVTSQFYWVTFIEKGLETIAIDEEIEIIEAVESEVDTVSFYEVEQTLKKILQKWSDFSPIVTIADKWKNGTMRLIPGNNTSNKDIPIDTFFHKIVMVRDRIRVMEQKINASKLNDAEKVDLQQYITRIYGSLTTFNVLFKVSTDFFVGDKSS